MFNQLQIVCQHYTNCYAYHFTISVGGVYSMIKGMADKLKQLRIQNSLSQKDVANKLGISPSIVSSYENASRLPSLENLLALSYLYKCSTYYLLGKTKDKPSISIDVSRLNQEQIDALNKLIKTIKA